VSTEFPEDEYKLKLYSFVNGCFVKHVMGVNAYIQKIEDDKEFELEANKHFLARILLYIRRTNFKGTTKISFFALIYSMGLEYLVDTFEKYKGWLLHKKYEIY
jgi:hypothetical protein